MLTRRSSLARGHQVFLRFFVSLFAGLVVAGCEPASQAFLSRGIGANLPTSQTDMANTHKLQRQYFDYLCKEAGLAGAAYGGPAGTCSLGATDAGTWTLIVQQGLNDIDRRCDAYLQWLDNRKRSNGPLINQITSIGAATTGIMGITGATTEALTVAALAFGLAVQSVENYNGLLLRIDTSTVNSVVLNARHNFRKNIKGKQFSNKPEAEYVLRSYLRLCLPFAIETNINDYSTFGSAGITPNENNTINRTPVVGTTIKPSQTFGSGRKSTVDPANIKAPEGFEKIFTNAKGYKEKDLTLLKKGLCMQNYSAKDFIKLSDQAIRLFEDTNFDSERFDKGPNSNRLIDDFEFNIITTLGNGSCQNAKTFFEKLQFELQPNAEEKSKKILQLVALLKARTSANLDGVSSLADDNLRKAIANAHVLYNSSTYGGIAKDAVTQELWNLLIKQPPPAGNSENAPNNGG